MVPRGQAGRRSERRRRATRSGGRLKRVFFQHATAAYLCAIAVLTAAGLSAVAAFVRATGARPVAEVWAFILAAVPVSEIAVFLVQRVVDALVPPRRLPRLDFRAGVPDGARTLVVFPTLFPNVASVEPMLRHLEVQALGTRTRTSTSPFCRTSRTPWSPRGATTTRSWRPPRAGSPT